MADALSQQYLAFFIAAEEYAVPILRVREIIAFGSMTRVPGAPAAIRGVINLRGSVVPVVDLSMKFRGAESTITNRTCVVILEILANGEQTVVGLLADAVSHVVELPSSMIEPPPSFGTAVQLEYLRGMGKADGRLVLVLEVDRLLAQQELASAAALEPAELEAIGAPHD